MADATYPLTEARSRLLRRSDAFVRPSRPRAIVRPPSPHQAGGGWAAKAGIASILLRLDGGVSAVLMANRAAWGRKGRIALQIFGSAGSILFDQERMNEFQLYQATERPEEQGFRTILAAPHHAPYDRFIPAPGHGLGFNDLKIIECRELMEVIDGRQAHVIGFEDGLRIERAVHAMAQSFHDRLWVDVDPNG